MIKVRNKSLLVIGKVVAMTILIILVANQVHWRDYQAISPQGVEEIRPGLASCLKDIRLIYYLGALLLQLAAIICTALRWRLLMMVQQIVLDNTSVIRLNFLGEFFNHFLPGAVGGDAVKAYYLMRHTGRKGPTLVSIFANRFAGLCLLAFISLLMLSFLLATGRGGIDIKRPVFSIYLICLLIALTLIFSLSKRLNESERLNRIVGFLPFSRQLNIVKEALHRYRGMTGLLVPVLSYSTVIVVCFILSVRCIGLSIDTAIPWYHYFLYLPLIAIMTSIPITPGGVGVLEELYLYFFSQAGEPNKILAMALLYRLVLLLCSLPGAMIFLAGKKLSRQQLIGGLDEFEMDLENNEDNAASK